MTEDPNPYAASANSPEAQLSPAQERQWGMIAHLAPLAAMLVSGGFLGFVGSLIVYVMYKDRGPFVRQHATNSLNVQISTFIAIVLGWILTFTLVFAIVGIPLLLLGYIGSVVIHIIGAIKANGGEWWDPPFTINFIK